MVVWCGSDVVSGQEGDNSRCVRHIKTVAAPLLRWCLSSSDLNGLCVRCSLLLCWGRSGKLPEAYRLTKLGVRCGAALCSQCLKAYVAFLQVCVKAAALGVFHLGLHCIQKIKTSLSISLQIYGVLPLSKVLLCLNSEVLPNAADPSDPCTWPTAAVLSGQAAFKAKYSGGHERRLQMPHQWVTFLCDSALQTAPSPWRKLLMLHM